MRAVKVWDLPVRLFHWALVLLILAAWTTQHFNMMDLHIWAGESILTLVLFRVLWGFVGSDTARFRTFLHKPAVALRHLAGPWRPEPDLHAGHNAAGGWMVVAMLALIGLQAGTGLFSNDDGDAEGPLMHLIRKSQSNALSRIHSLTFVAIEAAIVLHVLAIGVYAAVKRQNLVWPMVRGTKRLPPETEPPRIAGPVRALATFAVAVAAVAWLVRL